MPKKYRRLSTALLLATTAIAAGCSDSSNYHNANSTGSSSGSVGGNGSTGPSSSSVGGDASSVQSTGASTTSAATPDCTDSNVVACGGDVVGTWNVASTCLALTGDMDVSLSSLGCLTVPVTGSLQTSGTITFNDDGSYTDSTTTTGSITFPLAEECLAISGVPVECSRAANIFAALGWTSAECTDNGGCSCSLSTEQQGGLGSVVPYTEPSGSYTSTDTTLTVTNVDYSYCASGDTLTLTPQMDALTGTIVLAREGTAVASSTDGTTTTGMSGATSTSSTDGTNTTGMGGATTTSMGGATSTSGGGDGGSGGSGGSGGNPATGPLPCDIYEAAGQPCVAAHSTVRALFGSFDGNLYQVKRNDGMTQDIPTLSAGGFADSSVQDSFCSGSTCTIWRVYDQSGHGNFIEAQTPDSTVGGHSGMTAANAAAEQLTVGGHQVYSLYTRPSQAYWNDGSQNGMPLGAEPQAVYMVTSGEHFNGGCCYNYGSGQLSRTYEGGPTMDSVYFGNCTIWGTGAGNGPWVMADMEDGIVSGANTGQNNNLESLPFPYVTAMEKNNGTTEFALRGASASAATLNTYYKGSLPGGKNPMKKQGGVLLGAGGDCCYSNNNASEGTFYEGAIVSGYPSDATEEEVHANIVEAGYGQ